MAGLAKDLLVSGTACQMHANVPLSGLVGEVGWSLFPLLPSCLSQSMGWEEKEQ